MRGLTAAVNPIDFVRSPIILGMVEVWDDDDLAAALAEELSRIAPTPTAPVVEQQTADVASGRGESPGPPGPPEPHQPPDRPQPPESLWPPLREQLSGLPAPTGRPVIVPGARDGFRSTFVPATAAPAPAVSTPSIVYDLVEPARLPRVGAGEDAVRYPPPVAGDEQKFDPPTG